MDSLVPDKT